MTPTFTDDNVLPSMKYRHSKISEVEGLAEHPLEVIELGNE